MQKKKAINEPEERKASFQEGLGRLKLEGGGDGEEEAEDGSKRHAILLYNVRDVRGSGLGKKVKLEEGRRLRARGEEL
jgi:hypothetical protein